MKQAMEVADALQVSLESLLRRIAEHCELGQAHQRISIYCYVAGAFVMLARNSENSNLKAAGRGIYPSHSGAIGEAWEIGKSSRRDWPADRDAWNNLQIDRYGFTLEMASSLQMQARSVVALRLTHDSEHVGVLVMESLKPRGVSERNLDLARESLLIASLCETMRSATPHFPAVARHHQTSRAAS